MDFFYEKVKSRLGHVLNEDSNSLVTDPFQHK